MECILWNNIASNTAEYCKKGDIIGIKGRIESRVIEENKINKTILQVIAEKVTFLSSKKQDES